MGILEKIKKTSFIYIDDRFARILENFRDDSVYAHLLLNRRVNSDLLVDGYVNYMSTSNKDLQRISYVTPGRTPKIMEKGLDIWKCSERYTCKPGSFLNKIFRDVSPVEVEKFASFWKTFAVERDNTFEIITGDDIRSYYGYRMHERREGGSLGVSCLRHDQCQDWFRFYIDNPEVVSLLVLLSDRGKVIGRALLWETSQGKIMDRIYTMCDEEYSGLFQKWAKDNGYTYKTFQNWSNTLQFKEKDLSVERNVEIKLKSWMYDKYPYLDTFKWLDCDKGMLYNYCPDHFEHSNLDKYRIICNTHGGYDRTDWLKLDEIDRAYAHIGDLQNVDGIITHSRNLEYCEVYNQNILKRDAIWREDIHSFVYSNDERNDQSKIKERLRHYAKYGKKESKLFTIDGDRFQRNDFYQYRENVREDAEPIAYAGQDINEMGTRAELIESQILWGERLMRQARGHVENGQIETHPVDPVNFELSETINEVEDLTEELVDEFESVNTTESLGQMPLFQHSSYQVYPTINTWWTEQVIENQTIEEN